jgi:hypothetical protein
MKYVKNQYRQATQHGCSDQPPGIPQRQFIIRVPGEDQVEYPEKEKPENPS